METLTFPALQREAERLSPSDGERMAEGRVRGWKLMQLMLFQSIATESCPYFRSGHADRFLDRESTDFPMFERGVFKIGKEMVKQMVKKQTSAGPGGQVTSACRRA